jgi:hypothetical protein
MPRVSRLIYLLDLRGCGSAALSFVELSFKRNRLEDSLDFLGE